MKSVIELKSCVSLVALLLGLGFLIERRDESRFYLDWYAFRRLGRVFFAIDFKIVADNLN